MDRDERNDERDETAQLAVTFAMDYLSFDQEDPDRWRQVLARYLFAESSHGHGWPGQGRQRAEFAVAGRHHLDGALCWVDVRVRVTPYHRLLPAAAGLPEPTGPGTPPAAQGTGAVRGDAVLASAPPPAAIGWVAEAAIWYRMSVPVRRSRSGAVFVDLGAAGGSAESGSRP